MRKFYPIAILFFFFSLSSLDAQRLRFGLEVDPDLNITNSNQFNVSGGALVYFDVSPKFQIASGLKINFQKYQVKEGIVFGCNFSSLGRFINNSTVNSIFKSNYLGVPLQLRAKLSAEKNYFYTAYSATVWRQINANAYIELEECGDTSTSLSSVPNIYKKWGFSNNIGIGYEFGFKEKFSSYVEARVGLSYYTENNFTPIVSSNHIVQQQQFEIGLSLGFKFN